MKAFLNKFLILGCCGLLMLSCRSGNDQTFTFEETNNRIWIGEKFWSIPMEDWQVADQRVEFRGKMEKARVNVLSPVMVSEPATFTVTANFGFNSDSIGAASVGFGFGIHDPLDPDVKAACYYGQGKQAYVSSTGLLVLQEQRETLPEQFDLSSFRLILEGQPADNGYQLMLKAEDDTGKSAYLTISEAGSLEGLVAVMTNFEDEKAGGAWFDNLSLEGKKFGEKPENTFGPVLWTMYTLDDSTLRMTAQMPPISAEDNQNLILQTGKNGQWETVQEQTVDPDGYNALFVVNNYVAGSDQDYRVLWKNQDQEYEYTGQIRQEPRDRPLVVGGLTCQEAGGYPYGPLVKNLTTKDPDLLYFSGDQLYEGNGGYPIKRTPEREAILSYLGKWYMFGWVFGDLMRDRPTVTVPDDHDVFQGNLWGEGGESISLEDWEKFRDAHSGYVQTPKMVNTVFRVQCGHLPEPFETKPLPTGINVWYTDLTYGKVSFGIISDRMFKSGPEKLGREIDGSRIDHIKEEIPASNLDRPNLNLLGERQIEFIEHWINDWQDANLKVLLSQTVFANVATHHGSERMFLYGDLDSGGWPKSARDRVVEKMRKAFAFHLNGDQHIPFIVQYGLDECRDAGYSFCTPAISTGYPRRFFPDELGIQVNNRPAHDLPNTGCYEDIFGNKNYIYAVGNPANDFRSENRYERAQKKSSGYGLVTFDQEKRTIKMEAFTFLAGQDTVTQEQFPGWPLTISQLDNYGKSIFGYLPELTLDQPGTLLKVYREDNDELVYSIRSVGDTYRPQVYQDGTYRVKAGENGNTKEWNGLKPVAGGNLQASK